MFNIVFEKKDRENDIYYFFALFGHFDDTFGRKRLPFPWIENLRQGFFGGLRCILTEKVLRHITVLHTKIIPSPCSICMISPYDLNIAIMHD